ncbi:hypothetical protein AAG570_008874 [Ranatra chinensis]|uniref:Uncharacterized protein n=1 Tax=Ranatra chinensis TaxID=642074 RepID=A0ABD0YS80_9HEMI
MIYVARNNGIDSTTHSKAREWGYSTSPPSGTEALINFNSTEEETSIFQDTYISKSPLIPCPFSGVSPTTDNNPFDVAFKATGREFQLQSPPFLRTNSENNRNHSTEILIEISNQSETDVTKSETDVTDKFKESVVTLRSNIKPGVVTGTGRLKCNSVGLNKSFQDQSYESLEILKDEDDIKVTIARRVSSCIQRALSCSYSQPDLRTVGTSNDMNNCSSSESNISRITPAKYFDSEDLYENQSVLVMNSSLQQHIFAEARKIAEMIANAGIGKKIHTDDVEDLMSEQPMSDLPVFSDEEVDEDGLPILKLSHVYRSEKNKSFTNSESEALKRFKNRNRASLDLSAMEEKKPFEKKQLNYSDGNIPDEHASPPDEIFADKFASPLRGRSQKSPTQAKEKMVVSALKEKSLKGNKKGMHVGKEEREGRPKTAPTVGDKPRVLVDLPKLFTSPQNRVGKSPFGKLISTFKRSSSLSARDKENRVIT